MMTINNDILKNLASQRWTFLAVYLKLIEPWRPDRS